MRGNYVIGKDQNMYYVHMEGFPYVPVMHSFCEKKSEAREYLKMMQGLPNRVQEIEDRRKSEFEKWLEED